MVGQGRPIAWKIFSNRCAHLQIGQESARLAICGLVLVLWLVGPSMECLAGEKTVRLRFAWGSGTAAKQRWTGEISIRGGVLTQLQPLGIEPDAPAAIRIDGSRLIIAPLEKRGFDGCDVTVRADEQALVHVELRSEQAPRGAVFEALLADVLANQLRNPLDELGSSFLAHRSPGDKLRVLPTRDHLVFDPGETWQLRLQPDLADELAVGSIFLDVELRAADDTKVSWRSSQKISDPSQLDRAIDFAIACPAVEGAYRLTVTARPEEGFATRFVPGQQAKPIASRDVEFVVIDPTEKLPVLVDEWLPVLTIDPANPRWWQRLPAWAQVPRLRDWTSGAVGNIRPVVRPTPKGEIVELPPAAQESDPYWQAYTLPVREPGVPHLIEIEYPLGVEQHLAISLIEPDAAGRVTTSQQDASLYSEATISTGEGEVGVHRFVVWPRTRSPQLLLVNRHQSAPGQYGKITLKRQDTSLASVDPYVGGEGERLVAGYLTKPMLADSFGAAETLDLDSGLSVQSWSTFLDGAQRLAQTLRMRGYNGVMISVAADGSGLYPSQVINPSPRYDTGLVASSGQDPMRKDVLEMLLRVFDREGIRVIPTVQFAAPLPRLEALRLSSNAQLTGIDCVGYYGQTWLAENATNDGLAPYYNPLNDRVQAELASLIAELTARYARHSSFAGVGVQVSGEGYGMLPGLEWCLDDASVAKFSASTGIATPKGVIERFSKRGNLLLGEHRQAWLQWRQQQLTQLYARLAEQVTAERSDLRLVLATEDVFAGHKLQQRVRQAIAEPIEFSEILLDHGLDLKQLDARPEITALVPHLLSVADRLQERALDLRVNSAAEQGDLLPSEQRTAELLYHASSRFRLPSFDETSPFGPEQTVLTVTSQPRSAGAHQRRPLAAALAADDAMMVVDGGLHVETTLDAHSRNVLRTLQQLPGPLTDVRTLDQQPVVMRVYRTNDATALAMINQAPWHVRADVALTGSRSSSWHRLGSHGEPTSDVASTGTLAGGEQQSWPVALQPYGLQAWRFTDEKLRVGELQVSMTDIAQQELDHRIQEIESRAGNLNIERPYAQLQNPGFELNDGSLRIVGWQPRQGAAGAIGLENRAPHSGVHALRLRSDDATGVAVQSHLFPAPETGQLLVSAYLRVERMDHGATLHVGVQDQDQGRRYRQFAVLDSKQLSSKGWLPFEFALADVPFGRHEQLRLHFHLAGEAELLVDDVKLCDLRFDSARRRALVKRIYAAKIALEQGQIVDCLRVVDDYWSRYMVEHVPPTGAVAELATKPSPVTDAANDSLEQPESKGIGSRLRDLVPRIRR